MLGVLWLACAGAPLESDAETDVVETDIVDTDVNDPPEEDVTTLAGNVTWHVDFDAATEAAGYVDCDYTRTYSASEDRSAPWLCRGCDVLFRADVEMTAGRTSCYRTFVQNDPSDYEAIGWGDGVYWRTPYSNIVLSEQGTATPDGDVVRIANSSDYPFTDGTGEKRATFSISGELTLGTARADPYWGMRSPERYECGWPRGNPPPYTGDYNMIIGEIVPDGTFPDRCGEGVRLHDLLGPWLVIDVSAKDCGPCRTMASEEPAFVAMMAAEGIDVRSVTLLQVSLSDPYTLASDDDIYDWEFAFDLTDPVLADRGWGYGVMGLGAEAATGEDFGYPTWALVNPAGEVIEVNVGFGGWESIAETIRANQ